MDVRHVPDLEQCQELDRLCKEKGIVMPETEYWWMAYDGLWELGSLKQDTIDCRYCDEYIPAPLASEQGECLPVSVQISWHKEGEWVCETFGARAWYEDGGNYPPKAPSFKSNTEANARQKMINHLIAEGIITKL